jgi:hypothetical protein
VAVSCWGFRQAQEKMAQRIDAILSQTLKKKNACYKSRWKKNMKNKLWIKKAIKELHKTTKTGQATF